MFVYIIINDVNDKIYIGKTQGSCLSRYLKQKFYDVKKGWNGVSHLYNAMKYYGIEHFHIYPLISTLTTNEDLGFWERVLIAQYDSQNPDIGYNICRGGEGFTGPHSEESRKKNSQNSISTWQDPEIRARRVNNQKKIRDERGGTFLTPDSINQIKAARAVQDENIRLTGWKENKGNAGRGLSHEAHVLGGKSGSREDKQRAGRMGAASGSEKARHIRWHVNRGRPNPECPLC